MRVITNISKMDLICLNLALLPKLRSTYMTILVLSLLAFGFICWKNGPPQTTNDWIAALLGSFGGGTSGALFGMVFSMFSILLMPTSRNGIFGEHEYILSPEGLHERTSANEGLIRWAGIEKVYVGGPYLLFQVSSYLFHIVPSRSFDSKQSFQEFVSSSMRFWENSHSSSVS